MATEPADAAAPGPPGAGRHRGITREGVVDAALTAFAREGPTASMKTIAQALGIRKSSLFSHVASKEQLYELVTDDVMRRVFSAVDGAAAGAPSAERLLQHCAAHPRDARFLTQAFLAGNARLLPLVARLGDAGVACSTLAVVLSVTFGVDAAEAATHLRRLRR